MEDSPDLWIVVPAYNEGRMICSVLDQVKHLTRNVVVVDDGSTDDTTERALKFPIVLLRHELNLGQGAALQTGISYALRFPSTRFIVTMDSDGQHGAGDIPRLLAPLRSGTHDVVLGSRFLREGKAFNIGASKRAVLRLAVAFTRLTTGLDLTDTHNGLRAFTAEAATRIAITQNGMAHSSEILSQISLLKLRWCEVPVTVTYTSYSMAKGQSILNSVNILWDMMKGRMR